MTDSQVIIEELQKKNRELIGKVAILQKQFDDALVVTHAFDGISAKNTELEKEIHNYISKNDDLTRRIQILSQTNAELTKKFNEEKSTLQSHSRCEINELQNRLNRCQSEHEKELISLKLKIDQTEKEHSFAIENYQKEIRRIYDAASQFLGTPIRETDTLITLLLSKTNQNANSQSQNSLQCPQCVRAKADLRTKDNSLKEIRSEIKSLKSHIQKSNTITRDQAISIEILNNEKAELLEANKFLNCQLDDIQKTCEEQLKELQFRHKKLKSKLSASVQKIEDLEKEKSVSEEELKSLKSTISEKEDEIHRLMNEVQRLTDQNAISDQTVTTLKEKCEELNVTLQKNNETAEENVIEAKNSQSALQTLQKILDEQKEEILSLQSQKLKLISHLQALDSTLGKFETHANELLSKKSQPSSQIDFTYSQFPSDLNKILSQILMNPEAKDEERVQNAFSIIFNYYNNIVTTLNESLNKYRNDLQIEQQRLNQIVENFNRRLQNSFDDRNFSDIQNPNNNYSNLGNNHNNGMGQNHYQSTNNMNHMRSDYLNESTYENNSGFQNRNNRPNIPMNNRNNGDFSFNQQNQQMPPNNSNIRDGSNNFSNAPYPNGNYNNDSFNFNPNNDDQPYYNRNNNNSNLNHQNRNNNPNLQPNNNSSFNPDNYNNYNNSNPRNEINRPNAPYSNNNPINDNQQPFMNNGNQNHPNFNNNLEYGINQENQPSFNNNDSNLRNDNSRFNNYNNNTNPPYGNQNNNNRNGDQSFNTMSRRDFEQQSQIQNSEIYRKFESLDKITLCQEKLLQKISQKENELHEIFAILHVNCFLDAKSCLEQIQNDIQLLQTKLKDKKGKLKELFNEYQHYQVDSEEKLESAKKAINKIQKKLQDTEDLRDIEKSQYESKIKELIDFNETSKEQMKQMKIRIDQKNEKNSECRNRLEEELRLKLNENEQLLQTIEELKSDISKKEIVIQQMRSFSKYFAERQSKKQKTEQEQMKSQLNQVIDQLKAKNSELKRLLNEMKEKLSISEQQYSKAKKQISDYSSKVKELEIQLESFQKEAERGKSLIESKHKAALIAQETEFQSHIEDSKYQIENAKREIMAYVGLQFCSLFNAKEQIDASNFESFIQRLRQKFEDLISIENNLRRMLSLNSDESIESAVSQLLSHKNC